MRADVISRENPVVHHIPCDCIGRLYFFKGEHCTRCGGPKCEDCNGCFVMKTALVYENGAPK